MMKLLLILCVIFLMLLCGALLRSAWEQKHFIVRDYTLRAEGLAGSLKAAVIADLHGAVYGRSNEELIRAIDEAAPDLILIPGDLITCRRGTAEMKAPDISLLRTLAARYPVYYAPGNHEENYLKLHPEYAREVAETGAVFLVNEVVTVNSDDFGRQDSASHFSGKIDPETLAACPADEIRKKNGMNPGNHVENAGEVSISVAGLAIGEEYYVRGKQPHMPADFLTDRLGPCPPGFTILLAHNPGYFPTYARWGCGCVISGHNHGGVIRLPLLGGVISASLHLFDRYDRGLFKEGRTTMVLSAGLGMHTLHVRLFNRPELVAVNFIGEKSSALLNFCSEKRTV